MSGLTEKQRRLTKELHDLSDLLSLDYQNIGGYESEARTPYLERAKDHLIRGAVILDYTLIDEHLSSLMCQYFFGKKTSFPRLWKTKHFRNFNYYVLEKLYVRDKLEFARAVCKIPADVANAIERINSLRNALAHSFFLENRRKPPRYKGKDIRTMDGFQEYWKDREMINSFFMRRLYRVR